MFPSPRPSRSKNTTKLAREAIWRVYRYNLNEATDDA